MTPDVAASVRARLLTVAKETGEEFERTLVRFAAERWLYRLGSSAARERCILKGAVLMSVWLPNPHRATRDVDLLGSGASDDDAIRQLITEVAETPCPEDGLAFDVSELTIEPIREEAAYAGVRALFWARLKHARIRMQVDIGFGDAIAHGPDEVMVQLEARNSRMKDFHDVWALAGAFAFDGTRLSDAVAACFARRLTPWAEELPAVLTSPFYESTAMRARWRSYVSAGAVQVAPPRDFAEVGDRLIAFLRPVRDAVVANSPLRAQWTTLGLWETADGEQP